MYYFLLIYFNNKPVNIKTHDIYQLLFVQSWSSWWWAASLLQTCRGLLLK